MLSLATVAGVKEDQGELEDLERFGVSDHYGVQFSCSWTPAGEAYIHRSSASCEKKVCGEDKLDKSEKK